MMTPRAVRLLRLLAAGLIVLAPAAATALTLTVTPAEAGSIGAALAGAVAGDIVLVGCGVYEESEIVVPDGVILRGVPEDAACVLIVPQDLQPAFILAGVGSQTRIENLTVQRTDGSGPPRGGGANLLDASPVFANCVFSGLTADYGGAVYCAGASAPLFSDCRFEDNTALAAGGAVACVGGAAPVFETCLFAGNAAVVGGTINAALGAAPDLTACTIVRGDGAAGAGLATWAAGAVALARVILVDGTAGRAWDGDAASVPTIICSDLHGNAGGDWVGALIGAAAVDGNLSAAPQFCGPADPDHPYGLNDTSPCAAAASGGCGDIGAFTVACSYASGTGGEGPGLPEVTRLHANYPNPFNPETTIRFELKQAGPVELTVYDVAGRLVRRLVDEPLTAGSHAVSWEGRDAASRPAAAGVYFYRLKTPDQVAVKRMTLIK